MGQSPLAKMNASFPNSREKGNGWWANDNNPRFDYLTTEDGTIRIHSHTGRTAEDILKMGDPPLKLTDLYPKNGTYQPVFREKQLDLLSLAEYLKLDWRFLYSIGYRDSYAYKNKQGRRTVCVKLGGYSTPDGREHSKVKVRLHVDGQKKTRFLWDQNTPGEPIPCGLHRLGDARQAGYLFVGEGESDAATMWFHGFPFLGISGADTVKHLDVSLLNGIPRIYIIEEPDQAEKNQETGQGFYASVRSHLRTNGYEGDISSIRFKLATGYKDPSEMHKSIYRQCDQAEEAPHLAEIKAKFAEVMFEAMELAIPEGNTGLATQEDFVPDPPPALPDDDHQRLLWVMQLNEVKADVMSAAQKIVLQTIMLYSPIWHHQDGSWWQVDAYHLCVRAGMSKQQFLTHLAYLSNVLGLFIKRLDREWVKDEKTGELILNASGKPTVKSSVLSIRPSPDTWLTYPSTYKVADGARHRKHGGKQEPNPKCRNCHSENIKIYEAHYCLDCKHMHIVRDDQDDANVVESTVEVPEEENILLKSQVDIPEVFPIDIDQSEEPLPQNTSETRKGAGNIYRDNNMNIHVPEVFFPDSPKTLLKSQVDIPEVFSVGQHEEPIPLSEQVVLDRLHAEKLKPCSACGCPLYHRPKHFPDEQWCCSCLPPRGIPDDIWRWIKDYYSASKRSTQKTWEVQKV